MNAAGATSVEKGKAIIPVVAPMIVAEAISVVCALVAHRKASEMIAAGANALATYKTMDDIRKEVVKETVGEEKAAEIEKKSVEERLSTAKDEEIEETGHGNTLFIDSKFTGRVWRSSKDYFELCIARLNNRIVSAYDTYGRLQRDGVAVSIGDFFREQGLRSATDLDNREYTARDFQRGLPIGLLPREFTRNGKTELGYEVDFRSEPTMTLDDRQVNYEHWR